MPIASRKRDYLCFVLSTQSTLLHFGLLTRIVLHSKAGGTLKRLDMELNDLPPKQVTALKDELSALCKRNFEALESAVYIRMNEEEGDEYDQSSVRISELYRLLGEFTAKFDVNLGSGLN